ILVRRVPDMSQRDAFGYRNVPQDALRGRVVNQKRLQNVGGNVAHAVRPDAHRDKLHFLDVMNSPFHQRRGLPDSLDDQLGEELANARAVLTSSRIPKAVLRDLWIRNQASGASKVF